MFLLQNVYTSKESTSYIVSSKLLQTLEAAIKERDDAVEDAVVNHYGDYNEEFVRKVKEHIDWNNLQGRMIQAENEAISAAIDAIINKG